MSSQNAEAANWTPIRRSVFAQVRGKPRVCGLVRVSGTSKPASPVESNPILRPVELDTRPSQLSRASGRNVARRPPRSLPCRRETQKGGSQRCATECYGTQRTQGWDIDVRPRECAGSRGERLATDHVALESGGEDPGRTRLPKATRLHRGGGGIGPAVCKPGRTCQTEYATAVGTLQVKR